MAAGGSWTRRLNQRRRAIILRSYYLFPCTKPDLGGYSLITGHFLAGVGGREYRAPACRSGAAMVTSDQCRTYSNEHKVRGIAADISIQRATAHMGISRSWTLLASEMKRLEAVIDEEVTTAQQNDFA